MKVEAAIRVAERNSLGSLVDDFEKNGPQIAVVGTRGVREYRTTYHQLASLARRFAAELFRLDIQKGDRVLLWGDNGPEWIAAFFGCVLRGVLPVPLDTAGSWDFADRIRAEVSPRLVILGREKAATRGFPGPVLILEDLSKLEPNKSHPPVASLALDDAFQIIFTSGTTGEPKGVVHTHRNVLASLQPIEREIARYRKYERLVHPLRFLHTLPLSHVFGQFMGLWIPPLLAAEVHFQSRLVARDLIEEIHRDRISVLAAVPRVLDLMQRYLQERYPQLSERIGAAAELKAWQRWWHFRDIHRLFGWKYWAFICGGASLSSAGEQFWTSLGFPVIQGYGMTETTALVSVNHPFRLARGTVGQVLPGREVRLSSEGEVLVRGETISNTVWRNGQLEKVAGDWLPTGDLAKFDTEGNLTFRGRKKDVIVTSSGLNIHPEDLEAALSRQAGVKAVAVIEANAESGPEPLAVLVLEESTNPRAVLESANRGLAEFQQLRRSLIWPEPDLPRTSTGKVLRREIRRRVASGEMSTPTHNGDSGSELNLDSLGQVQLQAELEQQYGVALDDTALQQVQTKGDLDQLIKSATVYPQDFQPRKQEQHAYLHWPWNPLQQAIRAVFLELVAMPLVRLLAKPKVTGKLRQWPASPMLIVANHVTSYDAAFVLYALPSRIRRRVAIAMSGEMLLDFRRGRNQGNWFLNRVAPIAYFLLTALFNVFPLPQRSGFRKSFRHAGEAVDRNYNVLVFPEGRRSDNESAQPFKSGAGLLWNELGVPALPVRLAGLGELKVNRGRWFRTGKIEIAVGDIQFLKAGDDAQTLTDVLRRSVFEIDPGTL